MIQLIVYILHFDPADKAHGPTKLKVKSVKLIMFIWKPTYQFLQL